MPNQIKKENDSGIIRINKNQIFWDNNNINILYFTVDEIAIIGEFTNADGPWFDDWFLVVVTKNGHCFNIPFYAGNINGLLHLLTETFRGNFTNCCLVNSTNLDSIVRYPMYLNGKKLFTLTPASNYKAPKTFIGKLLLSIGFGNNNMDLIIDLTEEIKTELKKHNSVL